MRGAFFFLFVFSVTTSLSQEKADSVKNRLKAEASVSINSNGIASIPAFSLGDPAIIASVSLTKNRFSYDPVLAYGFDMRPWFIDNWLHYRIIRKKDLEIRTGVNFSTFFTKNKFQDKTILQADRYLAFEIAALYRVSEKTSLTLMYWNDRGQEEGTIKGHFFSLAGDINDIRAGESIVLSAGAQLFYINYDGSNDGLFISPRISASAVRLPFDLFLQATQVISSNIEPDPGFKWNIGLACNL